MNFDWYESEDGQRARIYVPDEPIVIQVSAGADSSSLLYLLCKYIQDHKLKNASIICYHFVDLTFFPTSESYFTKIFDLFKKEFPDVKMAPYFFKAITIANPHPPERKYTSEELDLIPKTKNYETRRGLTKIKEKFPQVKFLYLGRTSHPPKEVTDQLNFETVLPDRSIDQKNLREDYLTDIQKNIFEVKAIPYQNVDKKFVASIYRQFPFLMQTIYPLTYSCLRMNSPCKRCDWCKEKMWAFGTYDFGIVD